jgi:hypothetical protein
MEVSNINTSGPSNSSFEISGDQSNKILTTVSLKNSLSTEELLEA